MNHPKKSELTHLSSILSSAIANCRPADDTGMLKIWDIWDIAVGERIAKNARPAAFKGDLLIVHVNSSVWMQQLGFLKTEIIAKLNEFLSEGSVREIRFKIGPLGNFEK
jgi:predicted nucleic acid-binding Zn ribbon protein